MSNRATLFTGLTLAALLALQPSPRAASAQEGIKTAVIDVRRILSESAAGKREMEKVKELEGVKTAQLAELETEIKKLRDKLTDLGFSISDSERTKLQREIEDRAIVGERLRKDSLRSIQTAYEDVLKSFEGLVGPIIEEIGSERGIQLILHRDNPAIAWADPMIDITPEVIARFDRKNP